MKKTFATMITLIIILANTTTSFASSNVALNTSEAYQQVNTYRLIYNLNKKNPTNSKLSNEIQNLKKPQ